MENPHISRIRIYPVKSLDPIELQSAELGTYSLLHDREFAILAKDGRLINGKRTGRVNELKASYDLEKQLIHLVPRAGGTSKSFALAEEDPALIKYLEDFFEIPVHFLRRTKGELMDIPKMSSITIVSEASLQSLQADIVDVSLENLRLRFRTNLEIGGVSPYWEEQLFQAPGVGMCFKIGKVELIGVSPRARCNVPPRDPLNGETDKSFIKKMLQSREAHLPDNSTLAQFGSLYHLTINLYLPESEKGKTINVGDPIEILEPVQLR